MNLLNWVINMIRKIRASKPKSYKLNTTFQINTHKESAKPQLPQSIKQASELIVTRSAGNLYVIVTEVKEKYPYSRALLHSIIDNNPNVNMKAVDVPRSVVRGIEIEAKRYKRNKENLRGTIHAQSIGTN